MKRIVLVLSLCLAACFPALPQIINASNAVNPYKLIGTAAAIKAQPCNPQTGDLAFATDAVAGENLYVCTSNNPVTWTIVGVDGAQVLSGTISSARIPGGLAVSSLSDSNANVALGVTAVTAGAINNFAIRAAATTAPPQFTIATTTDTNVGMTFAPKGTGAFNVTQSTNTGPGLSVIGVASAVNGLGITPGATGTPVAVSSNITGADTVADINLTCKGTGCAVIAPNAIYNASGNATVAQVNSGLIIVPAITGHTLKLVHFYLAARGGAAATCTDVRLGDSNFANGIVVDPVANLTQNAGNTEGTSSIAQSGFGTTAFGANLGIGIFKTGSSCATVTSFDYQVSYTINY